MDGMVLLRSTWSVLIPVSDMPDLNDLYVLISAQQLDLLLGAVKELPKLQHELKRCYEQLDACRTIQTEVLEKYRELYQML